MKLKQVRHESYFVILETTPQATRQQVREAYDLVSRRFQPERMTRELAERYHDELAEIRDGLEDAYAVLSDDELRKAFIR